MVEYLTVPDAKLVRHAVQAVDGIGSLGACANASLLRSEVRPPTDPAARAKLAEIRVALAAAQARFTATRYGEALALARPAADAARAAGDLPVRAEAALLVGRLLDYQGETAAAEETLHEAAVLGELAGRHDLAARAIGQLVYVVGVTRERREEGLRWAERMQPFIERVGGDLELEALREQQTGTVLREWGKPPEALPHVQRALALREQQLGKEDPRLEHSVEVLGITLHELHRDDEALAALQRAERLLSAHQGERNADVARLLVNTGAILHGRKQYAEALELSRRALAIIEQVYGAGHPETSLHLRNVAEGLCELGRPEEGLPFAQRALAAAERGTSARDVTGSLAVEGDCLLRAGRAQAALVPLERGEQLIARSQQQPSFHGRVLFSLAQALWSSGGDRARARSIAGQARELLAGEDEERAQVTAWLAQHDAASPPRTER